MPTPSVLIVPNRLKAGILYSQLPANGDVDFSVTRATIAYRTNASGILESVASGVPRLDYPIGGGCPSLLVEPAATNLVLRSEEFSDVIWVKNTTTVTANAEVAPNGATTAETMTVSTVDSRVEQTTVLGAGTYTFSVYVRLIAQTTAGVMRLQVNTDGSNVSVNFTPTTQWQRVTATVTAVTGVTAVRIRGLTFVGTIAIWGAQLEVGSVATSYIPTVAATATRNADVISKTGVSGFIGQTEGTIYAEVNLTEWTNAKRIFAISDGTQNNRIAFLINTTNRIRALVTQTGATQADINTSTGLANGVYKIALAYAANDFVLYVNGSQIGTDTSGAVPACTDVYLGKLETSSATLQLNDRIRAAAIYPTRLTNSQLASLTTL